MVVERRKVLRDSEVRRAPGTQRSTTQRILRASSSGEAAEAAEAASWGSAASFSRQTGASGRILSVVCAGGQA